MYTLWNALPSGSSKLNTPTGVPDGEFSVTTLDTKLIPLIGSLTSMTLTHSAAVMLSVPSEHQFFFLL